MEDAGGGAGIEVQAGAAARSADGGNQIIRNRADGTELMFGIHGFFFFETVSLKTS